MSRELKLYLGGSLFSKGQGKERLEEERLIKELGGFDVYNPISAPCNDKTKLPTAKDIFIGDTTEIVTSEVAVFDLSNQTDLGVAMELGVVYGINYMLELLKSGIAPETIMACIPSKITLTHLSDIRKETAHEYKGNYIPWGYNQYVIGGVESMGGYIGNDFESVLGELEKIKNIFEAVEDSIKNQELEEDKINDLKGENIDE